jgi:hypothetical protein
VIPGYLVPLLIVKPITAGVIVFESLLTYWAAHLISERVRFRGCWSSFFGRDRFFLIVILSVFVRLVFDGLLLPRVGLWFPAWRIDLHSFGLIAVPLIANYLWKPGAIRGLLHLQVVVSVTYLITRHIVIPYTNFRMSGLFYMYEDAAGSMLSSPKSYIILITTAYLASRVNLKYGWEYSGILIPALLALEWITPFKIAASIMEAAVILIGARLLLSTSLLRGMTVERARKIVLFFSIGYAWRLFLGFHLNRFEPQWQPSDVYGFGYLLSTLLAIKAHDRGAAIRIAGATLRLCGAGGVLGCAIGFGLLFAPSPPDLLSEAAVPPAVTQPQPRFERDLASQLHIDKLRLYAASMPGQFHEASETELNAFDSGLRTLTHLKSTMISEPFNRGSRWMSAAGMEVGIVDSRYCYIREQEPARGRGLYVIDLLSDSDLVVAAPNPLSTPETLEVAFTLFQRHSARALLIGFDRPSQIVETSSRTARSQNYFEHAVHLVNGGNLLVVDGEDPHSPATDHLWIKREPPADLNLSLMRDVLPELSVGWGAPALSMPWLDGFWDGVAVLNISLESRLTLAGDSFSQEGIDACGLPRSNFSLSRWMLEQQDRIAAEGSGAYRPATLAEMFYLDTELITPLIQIAWQSQSLSAIGKLDANRLRLASLAAATMDLQLFALSDESAGGEYLVLRDAPGGNSRHWGTFVFRLGAAFPAIFEVSRPLAELRTLEFGTTAFEASHGFALLLTGAHLRANSDGSSDLLQFTNKVSLLHLVRQVLLRSPEEPRMLFVQIRGARFSFPEQSILSPGTLVASPDELPPLTRQLRESLRKDLGVESIFNGERAEAAGYTVSGFYANLMRSQPASRELASLWLSEGLRNHYRSVGDSALMKDQFLALGIPTCEAKLTEYLLSGTREASPSSNRQIPEESKRERLKTTLSKYLAGQDILLLRQLQHNFADWNWLLLTDVESRQLYLIFSSHEGGYRFVANLAPGLHESVPKWHERPTAGNLQFFIRQRDRWIEFGRRP